MSFTGVYARLEKPPFHRVAGEHQSVAEILAGEVASSVPKFQFSNRRGIERIGCKPLGVLHRVYFLQSALGSFVLGDRDSAIERDYRRRTELHQLVVEPHDSAPIGVFRACRAAVSSRDRSFKVIRSQFRTRCGTIEKLLSLIY